MLHYEKGGGSELKALKKKKERWKENFAWQGHLLSQPELAIC